MPTYVRLLKDSEAEARVAAAGKVAALCKVLPNEQVCLAQVALGHLYHCYADAPGCYARNLGWQPFVTFC